MLLVILLIVFVSINVVSASENVTESPVISNVVLNSSDANLLGDNLTYNATLNYNNNTPVVNQKLIFSVNGINYTRTTNLMGSAFLNINLDDGIYPISTIYKDANNDELINMNTIYVSHNKGTLIKGNLTGSEIQKIIDNANAGDSLIFAGSSYKDVSINVNKPLKLISIVKSIFNGKSKVPVIKVNSDNVTISNFVISSGSQGIILDGVKNVTITYNEIINNVWGIYLIDSANTNISFNTFNNNYDGIYFGENVVGTQIISNYMSGSENSAVNFDKSGSHTNMSYNVLEYNENGILFDMDGDDDINIQFNSIQRNYENGINFGENYRKTSDDSVLGIANNSIVYNSGFNLLARDSGYLNINIKDNYVASDNPRFNGVCEKIKFKKFHMKVTQLNGNQLSVSVDGIKTDTILRVSYNGGKNWNTVGLANGQATLKISNDDGKVTFDYYGENQNENYNYQMENYDPNAPEPVTPTNPDNPTPTDSSGDSGGNGTDVNRGEQTEGNGTASNPNSGSSQPQNVADSNNAISSQSTESSSSQTASQAVSSDSSSQSVSKQADTNKVVKLLSIDEEVVRIAGLSFIVLLVIAVIGLYYRDDVEYMLNKRNGR